MIGHRSLTIARRNRRRARSAAPTPPAPPAVEVVDHSMLEGLQICDLDHMAPFTQGRM